MFSLLIAAAVAANPVPVQVVSASAEIVTATRLGDATEASPRPYIIVRATGAVGSSGWSNARLVAPVATVGRDGGALELDLLILADRPGGMALAVPQSVNAALIVEVAAPGELRVVRVRGANGTVVEVEIKGPAGSRRQFPDQVAPAPGSGIPKRDRPGTPH